MAGFGKTLLALAAAAGLLGVAAAQTATPPQTLAEARAGKTPNLGTKARQRDKPETPPVSWMKLVSYPGPLGPMAAYLAGVPETEERRPAILWISGGNTAIGDFWSPQPRANDQSAAAFREAGMVVFYPAVRGLNGNPGQIESYFGELDDLVAATRWLKAQPFVDPDKVYLGGHSSGGTMALLASEYASEWAGVVAFGPVTDPQFYGEGLWGVQPVAAKDAAGQRLRAPINWLSSITAPTLVIEGRQGNAGEIAAFTKANGNPKARFHVVEGCSHFSILRPASELVAAAIRDASFADLLKRDGFELICG
ncbi:alpha/beta hydrolase family protein [Erythrobacter oryzae]|uniref:alpha/beta hydrolase family protein n=1 Tax=Erythrobacter oryzae TaxID=3019556 RepID=UPI00255797F8|nr:prolyl oligopeptidase family serine peptidase [Erythrobacter sp. COR-2]